MPRRPSQLEKTIESWIAHGFWFLKWFATEWASRLIRMPAEDKLHDEKACQRLSDLAHWLFFGESPDQGSGPLPPI